jgi:hypothetical protein
MSFPSMQCSRLDERVSVSWTPPGANPRETGALSRGTGTLNRAVTRCLHRPVTVAPLSPKLESEESACQSKQQSIITTQRNTMSTRLGIIAKPPSITSPAITHWRLTTRTQHRDTCITQHTTPPRQPRLTRSTTATRSRQPDNSGGQRGRCVWCLRRSARFRTGRDEFAVRILRRGEKSNGDGNNRT